MRSVRLLTIVAFLATPGALAAQTATGTVGAQAKVQSAVTFQTPLRNIDFGTITPGTGATVAPGLTSGVIAVQYNTAANITVGTLTLNRTGGGSLPVTVACAQAATSNVATPNTFTCATGFTTSLSGNAVTTWFIYVGGTITAAATSAVPAGNYAGTVTVTASFSTF